MIGNLTTASENLHAALEQYLHVCDSLYTSYSQGKVFSSPNEEDTHQINTELGSIFSHEKRIRQARLTMTRARNLLFSFAPINSLPPEILARIFGMIVDSQPCILLAAYDEVSINRDHAYPDLLAQVCSRWRYIVESHPSLWAHIDFVPNRNYAKLLSRANAYAKRAQTIPLDIHIIGIENAEYKYQELVKVLESLAGRMRTLDLFVTEEEIGNFYSLVLEKLLPKSSPTIFTRLSLRTNRERGNVFITPSKTHHYGGHRDSLPVDIPQETLDSSLASLASLDLRAIFLNWRSKAYHGLVELRLTSSMDELFSQIPERDLIAILKASPKLRILHFAINIVNQQRGSKLNGSVVLSDLEELEICAAYEFQEEPTLKVASLLRLLTPGNKPLSLMLRTAEYGPGAPWETIKAFLARSRVTKFHAKTGAPLIDELLRHTPHLTELVFTSLSAYGSAAEITLEALKQAVKDAPTIKSPITSLTMKNCATYLSHLQILTELYPTKSLVLYNCNVWKDEETFSKRPINEAQLSGSFPTIKFIREKKSQLKLDPATGSASNSDPGSNFES